MKTYDEYMEKFFSSGNGIDAYLKKGDTVDLKMAQLIIGGAMNTEELEEWDKGIIQAKIPTDILNGLGVYETIGRCNKIDPFTYFGQCIQGNIKNINPALGQRVYVCSPYFADTANESIRNTEIATEICKRIMKEGDYPIAPHLYFTRFLNDGNAKERELGIMAGLQLMKHCDKILLYRENGRISQGMKRELEYNANNLGIPVEILDVESRKR